MKMAKQRDLSEELRNIKIGKRGTIIKTRLSKPSLAERVARHKWNDKIWD